MQSSTQTIWVAQRDRGKDTMAIVKSEAPCADNARNNTARNRPSKACQRSKSTLGNFHAIPVFSLMSYLAFQSFLAVKKQLADLHAGQTNGAGPFLLVLRANESAQALRGRVVEESLQDSLLACPLCNQYTAEPYTVYNGHLQKNTRLKIRVAGRNSGYLIKEIHYNTFAREWRCIWSEDDDKRSLTEIQRVLEERWWICRGPGMSRKPHSCPIPSFNPERYIFYIFQSQLDRFQVAEL